ncbi:MAG TPA: hypothetical protein VFM13_07305 [Gaiellaceae bacterium]|nr:hypothetical protein [Gaiellaceae bacterium]
MPRITTSARRRLDSPWANDEGIVYPRPRTLTQWALVALAAVATIALVIVTVWLVARAGG